MAMSKWLCTKSTNNMVVKIVHPGGYIEFYDRPVLALEIMHQNQKCVLAYPHVFRQPWAVVAPDTVLRLGHKFYVVPVSTIRKLQKHSLKHRTFQIRNMPISESASEIIVGPEDSGRKVECLSDDNCFRILLRIKIITKKLGDNRSSRESGLSSSSCLGYSETGELVRKRNKNFPARGSSPNPIFTLSNHWQPGLESTAKNDVVIELIIMNL